jgi:release factor glutamine methyltransferase
MNKAPDTSPIGELLRQAAQRINSDSPRLDAEVLLAHVLDKPRSHLLAWPDRIPDTAQQARYRELIERRADGEPVAYITGEREFWSLPVTVTHDTLIPRPETETLVAMALEQLPPDHHARVADLGTGSGAIALAIAHERPACHILACDRSTAALAIATRNARQLQLNNIDFASGDWCEALAGGYFDLIVSNPPYIPAADKHLACGDVRFEPQDALVAGDEGLDDIRRIAACARSHLRDNALLILEHGFDQREPVRRILAEHGYRDIVCNNDLAGRARVTLCRSGRD